MPQHSSQIEKKIKDKHKILKKQIEMTNSIQKNTQRDY